MCKGKAKEARIIFTRGLLRGEKQLKKTKYLKEQDVHPFSGVWREAGITGHTPVTHTRGLFTVSKQPGLHVFSTVGTN